jgi:hypothetical protein
VEASAKDFAQLLGAVERHTRAAEQLLQSIVGARIALRQLDLQELHRDAL